MIKNLIAFCLVLSFACCNEKKTQVQNDVTVDVDSNSSTNKIAPANLDTMVNTDQPVNQNPAYVLSLVSEGLQVINAQNGSANTLAFHLDKNQVISVVSNVLTSKYKDSVVNMECGGLSIFTWSNGLSLNFAKAPGKTQDEFHFVGWSLNTDGGAKSTLTTTAGVGIGSTLQEVMAAYETKKKKTTLGLEIMMGKMTALLAKDAPGDRVVNMWCGTNCIFR